MGLVLHVERIDTGRKAETKRWNRTIKVGNFCQIRLSRMQTKTSEDRNVRSKARTTRTMRFVGYDSIKNC